MAMFGRLHLETGSQKIRMTAPNRVYLYLSFYARLQISSKGYLHVFGFRELNGDIANASSLNRK
jgi:hypothetical protein